MIAAPATRIRSFLFAAFLAAITIAVYWQVKDHDFIPYDDFGYVANNYFIQPGVTWENVVWAFTTGYVANWHPLTWVSHMLDYQWFGFDPAGHHLHNVILHALTSILLFFLFRRMTGEELPSAFVAVVFALHPLHVESVAWVSERKDTLSALLWVLTMAAYVRYTGRTTIARYLLVLLLFALGLMAKPMLVTLPFVLLLLDYWPLRRISSESGWEDTRQLILEKVPMILLSIGSSVITFLVQQQWGAVVSLTGLTAGVRLANAVVSYVAYIGKSFWPVDLAVFYPHPVGQVSATGIVGSVFLLIAITIVCLRIYKHHPFLSVGWFWFTATLVPVIGLVQVGAQGMADRYMYLPLIGLSVMVAWTFAELAKGRRIWKYANIICFLAATGAMMILTDRQLKHWRDGESLFKHSLQVTSNNWMAHHILGVIYEHRDELDKAKYHLERMVNIRPQVASAWYDLGKVQLRLGYDDEAIRSIEKALEMDSTIEKAHLHLGKVLAEKGQLEVALYHFSKAYDRNKYYGEPHHNLALALIDTGQYKKAMEYLNTALTVAPNDSTILSDFGRVKKLIGEKGRK